MSRPMAAAGGGGRPIAGPLWPEVTALQSIALLDYRSA